MRKVLCLCPEIPGLEASTHVTILTHAFELRGTTGTARLAAKALTRSLWEVGELNKIPFPAGAALLFPREDAIELTADHKFSTLVVPDGTWSQVAKRIRRESRLRALPAVRLPAGPPSRFALREQRHPQGLCTLEAIARALGVLHGSLVEEALLTLLDKMVERTLWSRGQLPASRTRYGIPQAAWDFDRQAGRRGGRPRLTPDV